MSSLSGDQDHEPHEDNPNEQAAKSAAENAQRRGRRRANDLRRCRLDRSSNEGGRLRRLLQSWLRRGHIHTCRVRKLAHSMADRCEALVRLGVNGP